MPLPTFAALLVPLIAGMTAQMSLNERLQGWQIEHAEEAGEVRFVCGDDCRRSALQCVSFTMAAALPDGAGIDVMLDGEIVPWGQIEFWFASALVSERQDFPELGKGAVDAKLSGPAPAVVHDTDMVTARYDISTPSGGIVGRLALWEHAGMVRGLRCSYREVAGEPVTTRILELEKYLLEQPPASP